MGKIKIMSKYRLVGRSFPLFVIFVFITLAVLLFGNLAFLFSEVLKITGIVFENNIIEAVTKGSVSFIGAAVFLAIVPTLRLGSERWFLLSAKGEKPGLRELFHYFTPAGILKSIKAVLYVSVRKLTALILFLFPSVCLFGVLYFSFKEGEISLYISYALMGASFILLVSGLCFYFVYTARYFAYYSIIVSNKTVRATDAFEKSAEITRGAYGTITMFRFSFLPWLILCALVIPSFYVWGYYKESKAMLSIYNDKMHT